MDYEDVVQEAADSLRQGESAYWRLAKLTHRATFGNGETGGGRESSLLGAQQAESRPIKVSMSKWCADVQAKAPGIKFSEWTGRVYRRIWAKYGEVDPKDRPSWTEAYYELGDNASPDAREERAVQHFLKDAPVEKRREVAVQLLGDPDVRSDVRKPGTGLRRAVAQAAVEAQEADAVRRVEQITKDPIGDQFERMGSWLDLRAALNEFADEVARVLPRLPPLPEGEDDPMGHAVLLRGSLERARSAVDGVGAYLSTGRVGGDVERFVQQVLEGAR